MTVKDYEDWMRSQFIGIDFSQGLVNVILNGDFESGNTGYWVLEKGTSFTIQSDEVYAGDYSAAVVGTHANWPEIRNTTRIPAHYGMKIHLDFMAKCDAEDMNVAIIYYAYDDTGHRVGRKETQYDGSTSWTLYSKDLTLDGIDASFSYINIGIAGMSVWCPDTIYVDNVNIGGGGSIGGNRVNVVQNDVGLLQADDLNLDAAKDLQVDVKTLPTVEANVDVTGNTIGLLQADDLMLENKDEWDEIVLSYTDDDLTGVVFKLSDATLVTYVLSYTDSKLTGFTRTKA